MFKKPHLACPHKVGSKDQSSKFVPDEAELDISDGELHPCMPREELWDGLGSGQVCHS